MPEPQTTPAINQDPNNQLSPTPVPPSSNKKFLLLVLGGVVVIALLILAIYWTLTGSKNLSFSRSTCQTTGQISSNWSCPKPADVNLSQDNPVAVWGAKLGEPIAIWSSNQNSGGLENQTSLGPNNFVVPYNSAYQIGVLYSGQALNIGEQGDLVVFYAKFDERNEAGGRIWYNYTPAQVSPGKWQKWTVQENQPNYLVIGNTDKSGKTYPMNPGYYFFSFFNNQDKIVASKTVVVGDPTKTYAEVKPDFNGVPIPKFMPKGQVK